MYNVKSYLEGMEGGDVNQYNQKKNSLERIKDKNSLGRESCTGLRDSEVMVNLLIPLCVDNSPSSNFTHDHSPQSVLHTFDSSVVLMAFPISSCILDISIFLIKSNTTFYILSVNLLF